MQQLSSSLVRVQHPDEDVRRRGRNTIILSLGLIGAALFSVPVAMMSPTRAIALSLVFIPLLIFGCTCIMARRGLVTPAAVIVLAVVVGAILADQFVAGILTTAVLILPISILIASITLRPWIVVSVLVFNFAVFGFFLWPLAPTGAVVINLQQFLMHGAILAVVVALISFIGASGTSSALREARAARQQAEEASAGLREAHASLEEQVRKRTAALQVALSEVEEHAAEQTRLLSENERQRLEIRELSVPVLPVAEQVLVMPLVGTLDEQRLMMLQEQALRAVEQMSARQLIVDITGVPLVDSHVAAGLFNVVQAARLLGAEVTLVGIRPEVAQAIVGLGIHMNTIRTYVDLRSALTHHSTPRSVWRHNAAN